MVWESGVLVRLRGYRLMTALEQSAVFRLNSVCSDANGMKASDKDQVPEAQGGSGEDAAEAGEREIWINAPRQAGIWQGMGFRPG